MAYSTLALRLSDELAVSLSKATRLIDDVGYTRASRLLDDVASTGTKTLSSWWKPALLTGGVVTVGGGTLYYREQDVERMKAIAEQSQSQEDTVRSIIESDLSPEARRALVEMYMRQTGAGGDDSGGAGGLLGNDTQTTLVLIVVVALVLKFALDDDD